MLNKISQIFKPRHHRATANLGWDSAKEKKGDKQKDTHYKKLNKIAILLTSFVSITPLIILTLINFYQYQIAYNADIKYPILRQTSNLKQTLESFIEERISALKLLILENSFEELNNYDNLFQIFHHLKNSFDGFVDLSIINSNGDQLTYIGPYNLVGKNYKQQEWFNDVIIKGTYVSDVFMGYRGFPHFTVAVLKEQKNNKFFILRATVNSDLFHEKLISQNLLLPTDVFLINRNGILQTPSNFYGKIFSKYALNIPPFSLKSELIKMFDKSKNELLIGYAYIKNTPFILIEITKSQSLMSNWLKTRNQLLLFLLISIISILIVVSWGSHKLINFIKESDLQTARILHEIEYTSKMASIGRLAAGVSHEINNPLAIINENAGMIDDIISVDANFPFKEKLERNVKSILRSVERCSRITHQLLGFAKRMDTKIEDIYIHELLEEVISFVRRDNLVATIILDDLRQDLKIKSDRGLLQQVFLNIINNAIEAVKDGGKVFINYFSIDENYVNVKIKDTGKGIAQKDLSHIFEPFFTTKKEYGTGLGLSITYGIVKKLGGNIQVESEINVGTIFTVTLPFEHAIIKEENE